MTVEIPLRERFDDPYGLLTYDALDAAQGVALRQQKHVDFRTFVPSADDTINMHGPSSVVTLPKPIFKLDSLSMSSLDALTMEDLEIEIPISVSEGWTLGTADFRVAYSWAPSLSFNIINGTVTSASVMANLPVDISGLLSTDSITLALPSYENTKITAASSFIDFTSHATGDFTAGPTDSIAFSNSTVALVSGDSELRFPISLLANVNKSNITGVRFRITANASGAFLCRAFRAVAANWKSAPMEIDTRRKCLRKGVPLNGAATATYTFPSAASGAWPITFRSTDPPSTADPLPIDLSTSISFYTGAKADTSTNAVALYFREIGLDENQQLDLDTTFTQADLDNFGTSLITQSGTTIWTTSNLPGKRVQPDFGRALYDPRPQSSLDLTPQSGLDGDTQFSLERTPDNVSISYLEAKLAWAGDPVVDPVNATLTLKDQSGTGYTFNSIPILAAQFYALFAEVVDDSMRARLYKLDTIGNLGALVFDSTTVIDDALIHRHKGRAGWFARLFDGDSYVLGVNPRSANFGEYISLPFYSDTSVAGARLASHYSPPLELVSLVESSDWGGEVTLDTAHGIEGAHRISNDRISNLQGFQTNALSLDNLRETEITFDLQLPSPIPAITAFLYSTDDRYIQLSVNPSLSGQWESFKLSLAPYYDLIQTGYYRLVILTSAGSPWYVGNLSCSTRVVAWDGRGDAIDPWGMDVTNWLPFLDVVNGSNDGLVFSERGAAMQIRARAIRQTAQITDISAQPKYAELGNFAWRDQYTTWQSGLTVSFTSSVSSKTVTFASTSTSTGDPIIARIWSFGDGVMDYGPNPVHTYALSGTYTVVLTIVDAKGQRKSTTGTVTV